MNNNEQIRFREMTKKPWWNYVMTLTAVLLYILGCHELKTMPKLSVPVSIIFFGVVMHSSISAIINEKLLRKYKKRANEKFNLIANICLYIILILTAILYYFNNFSIIYVLLVDILSVIGYFSISSLINHKNYK